MNGLKYPVHSDPDILGGKPVFEGTRVPFQALLDYLQGGDSIDEFLDSFPSVGREQVIEALRQAGEMLVSVACPVHVPDSAGTLALPLATR